MEWHPVTEILPELGKWVLVWDSSICRPRVVRLGKNDLIGPDYRNWLDDKNVTYPADLQWDKRKITHWCEIKIP